MRDGKAAAAKLGVTLRETFAEALRGLVVAAAPGGKSAAHRRGVAAAEILRGPGLEQPAADHRTAKKRIEEILEKL